MNLIDASIRRPVMAWMIMAACVLFGGIALWRIGVSQYPDVDYPVISVTITWEGAAPELVDVEVVDVIEEALTQVEGVRDIRSTSRRGSATISVEMQLGRDIDAAMQDVQSRIAQVARRLPREIDPPVVEKRNPEDQPILWMGLSGPFSPQVLADWVRYRVKERLQVIPGVGEVVLGGYRERNIRVWLDVDRLDQHGVTASEVVDAIGRQHLELPGGSLKAGGREVAVRVLGEAFDLDQLRGVVIGGPAEAPVRLSDVALVEDGFEDLTRLNRVDGLPAQGIGIRKQRGANAVQVGADVRAAIAALGKELPEGMQLTVNFDLTPYIEHSISELRFEIIQSILLTAVVSWLFLRSFTSTLNVLLAIPMSLFGALAIVFAFGWTLNLFTLLALGLAVGIVVDDAILVLESIVRRREQGDDPPTAAARGTKSIAFAALAASVAVVAIIVPVVFMRGVIGKFFLQFGIALSLAVLLSYLEAVTLAPSRCAQFLRVGHRGGGLGGVVDRVLDAVARLYDRALAVTLRRPWWTTAAAMGLFGCSLYAFARLPMELVPAQEQSRLRVTLQTNVGADIRETDELVRKAEAVVRARPEVEVVYAIAGGFGGQPINGGTLLLTLVPPNRRALSQQQLLAELRRELNAIPGLRAIPQDPSVEGFGGGGKPVEFTIGGADWDQVVAASQEAKRQLDASGTAADVISDWRLGSPELAVEPDRARAADLGIPVQDLATTVQTVVGGLRVAKFTTQGRRIDLRVQVLAAQRNQPDDLGRLHLRARDGSLVPMSMLVRSTEHATLQQITRRARERAVTVSANIAPGSSQGAALAVVERIGANLPTGLRLQLAGASQAYTETGWDLVFAFILGLAVAYMVLAAQFNSFIHPVTVLMVLPLALSGGVLALLLAGKTLNLFSGIGLILLMGVAKKNSIVLVDVAARRRAEGADPITAMRDAGAARLRPILMTSIAIIAAALPIAIGLGPGGELRAPMAIAIVGGMIVATTLSLLVVPAIFVLFERLRSPSPAPVTVTAPTDDVGTGAVLALDDG